MTTSTDSLCSQRLAECLTEGAARARVLGRAVIVSVAEEIQAVDPLDVLQAAEGRRRGSAMYWTRRSESFAMAAFGTVQDVRPSGLTRFADADRVWQSLLENAVIDDPSGGLDGVGPVLAGGFSFDPEGSAAQEWHDFPASCLAVPRVQVAASGGRHWITSSVRVAPDGSPDMDPADLTALGELLLREGRELRPPADERAECPPGNGPHVRFADGQPASAWSQHVAAALASIRSGDLEKVVLARTRLARASGAIDACAVLRHLRATYPDCYVFGCWSGASAFVGASPERLVRLDGREVRASSLAGSAPRGATRAEDAALAAALLVSAKDRAEHAMVRDALDVGLAALCDDVDAPRSPSLFTLPHVHHLHTAVRARLRPGRSLLDLVAALHPTPAVGGSPRDAALRFIRREESLDRGWYAGPIGWVGRQRGEFAVALRSGLIRGDAAWLFAGCGIVADSEPAAEYAETLLKLRPMELALAASFAPAPE